MNLFDYTTYDASSLEQAFSTSIKNGLQPHIVVERQKIYGFNEIPEKIPAWWHFLLQQLKSPFLLVLMAAALLSFFLEGYSTGLMIGLIIAVNTIVGFYQEFMADRSVRLLKNMIPRTVVVVRDGKDVEVPSRNLVPGDIVIIEAGTIIPADIRFVAADDLMVDESALTGESIAVRKKAEPLGAPAESTVQATNIGFSGSMVIVGHGIGVVIETGPRAFQGSLGVLAGTIVSESVFAHEISHFTALLLKVIIVFCVLFIVLHVAWGSYQADVFQMVLFAISLAITITPEALPIIILFTLSRSARRLAQDHVIVKRLSAVNDLGSIQVLCVDKTGTLTENKMMVADFTTDNEERLFLYAALACEHPHVEGRVAHSLDDAIWQRVTDVMHEKIGAHTVVQIIPFDPAKRSNAMVVDMDGKRLHILRGAYEVVAQECGIPANDPRAAWAAEQGKLGRRVLAIAVNNELVGLISFSDPLKATVKESLKKAQHLNVRIKLITGDAPEVAGAIALESGIITSMQEVVLGQTVAKMSPEELAHTVEKCHVFARVAPDQKLLIIQTLQKKHAVGFMGDGINDVLALKAAHVGIVVQGCADIAREAADIILLQKSLGSIIDGIQHGRAAVINTKKYVTTTLTAGIGNFFALAISSLFIDFLPLQPVQILLLNFLSDFPMLAISGDTVDQDELRISARFDMPWLLTLVMVLGSITAAFLLVFFYMFVQEPRAVLQTYWFMASMYTELVLAFSIRTKKPFWRAHRPATMLLILSSSVACATLLIPTTVFGQHFFAFVAPSLHWLSIVGMVTLTYFITIEITKLILHRYRIKITKMVVSLFS